MRSFLRVAAALAAMSESAAGGGGPGDPRDEELARLREENARLRGGERTRTDDRPPDEVERAAREQGLKGPGQAEQALREAARQARLEEERGGVAQGRKRLSGDDGTRELARFIHQNSVFQQGTSQEQLDRLRISLGDEDHEAHVAIRDYHRALANDRGHPNTPAGSVALQKEIEDTRKAVETNPLAKALLEKIEKARRRNEPVDLNEEA
jgi:hypothetical protein